VQSNSDDKVIDIPTKEELDQVIPPKDVMEAISNLASLTDFTKEKLKHVFYRALALKSLDQFDDMDERCRQALYIMVAQLKAKQATEQSES
jgi:hypothetical protein